MIHYGAVLKIYREDTLPDIRANFETMKRLGMNTAVIWPSVYYWEKKTADYPYRTGKQILQMAQEIGIQIVMETAGQLVSLEYMPDFRMKDEYYCTTKDGNITRDNEHFFFGYINYFHPEVKAYIQDYLVGIAQAYQDAPALLGYDIWNETMFASFDHYTMEVFAQWLVCKYSTIDRLNDAWESTYTAFSQIHYNQLLWASVMPLVDYECFHKDAIGQIVQSWTSIMHTADPKHLCIADNIHSVLTYGNGSGERAQDDWLLAKSVDQLGISFYPKGGKEIMPPWLRSLTFSAIFSATNRKGFWISEMQSHHQALFNPMSYVQPWMLRQWTFEAVAHGAKSVIFWKLNNFSKGLQTGGRGLLDSNGQNTSRSAEVARMATALHNIEQVETYTPIQAKVAILYDRFAQDFTHAFTAGYAPHISQTFYGDGIRGAYKAFWEQSIAVDILTTQQLIDGQGTEYVLLIVTGQLSMSQDLASALISYCEQGGIVLSDGKLAQIANDSVQYPLYPGLLHHHIGYTVEDMEPAPCGFSVENCNDLFTAYYERKLLHKGFDADVLGRFEDGYPALLRKVIGKGEWLSLLTMLWVGWLTQESSADNFVKMLDQRYHLREVWVEDARIHVYAMPGTDPMRLMILNTSEDAFETVIYQRERSVSLQCTPNMAEFLTFA